MLLFVLDTPYMLHLNLSYSDMLHFQIFDFLVHGKEGVVGGDFVVEGDGNLAGLKNSAFQAVVVINP